MTDGPVFMTERPREVLAVHPPRFRPWATTVVLGVNALAFLLLTLADAWSRPPLSNFLLRTLTGLSGDPGLYLDFGASFGPYIRRGEYWRLVMPMFLHIGLIHFLLNNYALLVLGRLLERVYGLGRFSLIYVASGVGSAFVSMARSQNISAGASGAIFGIAGAMLITGYLHRESVPPRWGRAFGTGMLPLIVVNLLLGYALRQWVDNWAHLGGLASGILLAVAIPPPQPAGIGVVSEERSEAIALGPAVVVTLAMVATIGHYQAERKIVRLIEDGTRLRLAHQAGQAVASFEQAARLAPRDERPREELGLLYLEQKRLADAIREFNEALRHNPKSVQAQVGLMKAYREQGDPARAEQLRAAIEKQTPHAEIREQVLGELTYAEKNYVEAIRHYELALTLNAQLAETHNNLAWLYATCDDERFRDPPAALEHAQRAVELTQWKDASIVDTLAEAYYANRQYQQAVKIQTKALELDPHSRELQDHMARYRKAAGG